MKTIFKQAFVNLDYSDQIKKAIQLEIELLRNSPEYDRSRLDEKKFLPTSCYSCFYGLVFDSSFNQKAKEFKEQIGEGKQKTEMGYTQEYCGTLLEHWAHRLWKEGREEEVLTVVRYIKGVTLPEIKL